MLYCLKHDYKLLYTEIQPPTLIEPSIDFMNKQHSAIDLWRRLYFVLSVQGNILFADKVDTVRIEADAAYAFTKRARKYKILFEKIFIFDDRKITGALIDNTTDSDRLYEIRDWFNVRSGMKHDRDIITTEDNFVNEIIFYHTARVDGDHKLKDAVAISYLTEEQLLNFEYSDINARFKTIHLMKQAGIRGTRNRRDSKNKTRYKHYAIKLENDNREIVPCLTKLSSDDRIIFNSSSLDDIMKKEGIFSNAGRTLYKYT